MNHKFDSIHNTSFLYITSLIRFTKEIPFASQIKIKKTNYSAAHRAGGRTPGGAVHRRGPP
jgi:hypothetical protein